ncbi:MAG: DUF2157 domain-containing protein [Cyanobacteriota bacterium]|nr:DUF2157 domain-containing protein [Cyanobacteriota bacterium]
MLINIDTDNPRLLEGLDVWLRLGLISDSQVRQLCQQYLSAPVPEPVRDEMPGTARMPVLRGGKELAPEPEERQPAGLRSTPKESPNLVSQLLQSLKAELSVRWLLFLGLFMVVVSSGLLAASQWERFPAVGQYLVLLAYTTAFWATAVWTGRSAGLRLTAQSLRLVTLLLVPMNFWAMDGLGLWGNFWEWGTAAIAAFVLTFIAINLTKKQQDRTSAINLTKKQQDRTSSETNISVNSKWRSRSVADATSLLFFNLLGLSYLQWGWGLGNFPIIAVYLGVIGTASITLSRNRNSTNNLANNSEPLTRVAIVIYALAILLMRAIFVARVDVALLGLAFGISGWILIKSNRETERENSARKNPFTQWQNRIGGCLLLLGWSVSVATQPWQAFAISGIGLWVLTERLKQYWQKADLAAIFIIGWQAYSSVGRLIPPELRQLAISTGTEIAKAENARGTLLTVTWLPYLIFMVLVTDWLYRRDKKELAQFGELMALGFGAFLSFLGFVNPLMRSLNLLASTLILAAVTYRRPRRTGVSPVPVPVPVPALLKQARRLFYMTHFVGLLAICSWIDYFLPNLSLGIWAAILLAMAVAEWTLFAVYHLLTKEKIAEAIATNDTLLSDSEGGEIAEAITTNEPLLSDSEGGEIAEAITTNEPLLSDSEGGEIAEAITTNYFIAEAIATNYILGFILAAISYCLLLLNLDIVGINNNCSDFTCKFAYQWGSIWLVIPVTLTIIAKYLKSQKETAITASLAGLIMAQFFTFSQPETRLIGLGVGTVLMLVNTRALRDEIAAAITVGFGLAFIACGLRETIPALSSLWSLGWLLAIAIVTSSLWLFRALILYRNTRLAPVYAPALDRWAIALCALELGVLTLHSLAVYQRLLPPSITAVVAAGLVLGAIAFRGRQRPTQAAAYSFAWGLELLVVEILGFAAESAIYLAIANFALGLISQLLGDWWQRKTGKENLRPFWQVIPIIYGIFGTLLRQDTFANWTGLTTFALALIFIGIGRRKAAFKPLVYLGITGISLALFEMLLYQVFDLPKGEQLIAFATLGASVMYVYRLLASWLGEYLGFEEGEIRNIAHCHWGISSFILISATEYPIVASKLLALGTGVVLSRYAIFQGKQIQGRNNRNKLAGEIWVYLGVLEGFALLLYVVDLLSLNETLLPWAGAIASLFAYFIYFAPWQNWGWENKPWRRVALVLPIAGLMATSFAVELGSDGWYLSVAIASFFYILMAKIDRQIRFTYVSAVLINWAIAVWFLQLGGNLNSLIYVTPPALSLLYFAQVEPNLKLPENRGQRHYLRIIASGIICVVALFDDGWTGIIPGVISIVTIFAGLGLRVRAFLYVGTATFLLNAFVQLVILSSIYSFLKWAIGLVVGIILIWIAATFETRREQIAALLQNWIGELENWE